MNSLSRSLVQLYSIGRNCQKIAQTGRVHAWRWLGLLGLLGLAFTPATSLAAGPSFTGATTALSVSQDANATTINYLLTVSDTDSGKTLTWSQNTAPAHGTLSFSAATASSGSTSITPGGTITYTPTALYSGADSFTVKVSDGVNTATRTISVTVDCITIGSNDVGVSARPGQIGTYWVETRGNNFGWITNVQSTFGGIPMRGYFQFRVGSGAWQTLGQFGSGNTAPNGATIRYVDTTPGNSTISQSFHIGWTSSAGTTTTGMTITPGAPPTGVTADASAVWNNSVNGTTVANLAQVGLYGGKYVLDSQSVANLFTLSSGVLSLGSGAMPAVGQIPTVTVRYYDPFQLDCNGNPIDNSPSAGAPAIQTLNFTIRDATPNPQASYVIGQPDFTTNAALTTRNTLDYPQSIAIDTNHNKVYIADTYNSRVLRYAWPITGNQPNAEILIGSGDYTAIDAETSRTNLNYPGGVAVDSAGNLWVADTGNSRVLRFPAAYQISTNLAAANLVLGQSSFTTLDVATNSSSMNLPYSLTIDAAGNLWVADSGNNRVLRFANANSKAIGAAADSVLGQSSFTTGGAATNQASMNYPQDLTTAGTTLFVSDAYNNRVLRYANAASKANGGNADGVLGQPNFTTATPQITQNGLTYPYGLCVDGFGGLYVADNYNFRVLVFSNAVSKANGANADAVIGTTSFTDTNLPGPVTQSLLNYADGLAYDARTKTLAVVDEGNSRALIFIAPVPVATTCSVAGNPNPSTYGGSVTFTATVTRTSGTATPSGTVTFSDGATTLGTGTLSGSGASATATYSTSALTAGSHTITATYGGDANFLTSSGSVPSGQTVDQATPTIATWPTASTITYGQTLASSTLSGGSASPGGTFAWTTSGTAPGAGTSSHSVTFTPTDSVNYRSVTSNVSVQVNQATPVVTTWPTPTAITYGQTLASSTLNGGSATPSGTFTWTTSSIAPNAGPNSESVTFTPSDTTDYTSVTSTVSVTVNKATPNVTQWPSAAAITYGQTLANSTLSGGSATPAGTFAWTTPSTAPAAGASSQSVTFTPTDTANYLTVSGSVSIAVNQATPTITTWPTASDITYGQTLANSTLSGGSATPAGTFAWTTSSTAPSAGTSSQSVTFTPNDSADYSTVTSSVNVTVDQATPTITTWPTASDITYGQAVTNSMLTGGVTTPSGTFTWSTPTNMPDAGTNAQSVTFTPDDATDYASVTNTVSLIVDQATPVVTNWPSASDIIFGQTLAASTLTGGSVSTDGAFTWTTPTFAPNAGTAPESVTFTPVDTTNYTSVTNSVDVTVDQAASVVTTWPTASPITYGEAVTNSVLSGGVATPSGTFTWTVPTNMPGAGTTNLSVTFTPDDAIDYAVATSTVSLTVNQATPVVTNWPTASDIVYGQTLAASTLTGGSVSTDGAFTWTTPSLVPNAGTAPESVTFTPVDTTNYTSVTNTVDVTVDQAASVVSTWPTASPITYGQVVTNSILSGGVAVPSGTFTWTVPTNIPGAGTVTLSITFTPDDAVDYTTVTDTISLTVNQATPVVTNWPTASAIVYGQTLAASTLTGGSVSTAGAFTWTTPTLAPDAGTVMESVTFTPVDTTNYTSTTGTVSVVVAPGTLAVVLDTNSLTQVYDGTGKSVVVLSPTTVEVDISYDASPNAPTNAGSYTVVASINNTNYAGSVTNTLVIVPAAQTINFTNLPPFAIDDTTYTLIATASSGLPVTFASSDDQVVSVSGNILTVQGLGSAMITAMQGGDGSNYLAATNVILPAVVNPIWSDLAIAIAVTNGYYTVTNVYFRPVEMLYVTNIGDIYTNVLLTITGNQGHTYEVQYKDDATTTNWQSFYFTTNLPSGVYPVVDGATNAARYYRLRRTPPTP